MITDISKLKDRGDFSPIVYGNIASICKVEGELYKMVKKYKRHNLIWLHMEFLKALLHSDMSYISTLHKEYNLSPQQSFELFKMDLENLNSGHVFNQSEYEKDTQDLIQTMKNIHKRIAIDFFTVGKGWWASSTSLFFLEGAVVEWILEAKNYFKIGDEKFIKRTFVQKTGTVFNEEKNKYIKLLEEADTRNLNTVSKEELASEIEIRLMMTEAERKSTELTEKGAFDGRGI